MYENIDINEFPRIRFVEGFEWEFESFPRI